MAINRILENGYSASHSFERLSSLVPRGKSLRLPRAASVTPCDNGIQSVLGPLAARFQPVFSEDPNSKCGSLLVIGC
jgi:hypothetical protein